MKSIPIPRQHCLKCGYSMDHTAPVFEDFNPRPGDVSICLKCGKISVFNEQMHFQEPTADELLKFLKDPQVIKAQLAIMQLPIMKKP